MYIYVQCLTKVFGNYIILVKKLKRSKDRFKKFILIFITLNNLQKFRYYRWRSKL